MTANRSGTRTGTIFCALCGLIIGLAGLPQASAQPALASPIDRIFRAQLRAGEPGCNVGVIDQGQLVHQQGYGLANMELAVPLDGTQVHRMGSVSKQFTAMAVLLLAEEGAIDLNADIHVYLPALTEYGAPVTINAMLGHVAGMGDYDLVAGSYEGPKAENAIELKSAAGGEFRLGNEDYLTIDEFYDVVKRVPLALQPESEFLYSNLAYFLLSMLVEEVSGESLRDYAQRRIFTPLDMQETFFSDLPVEIVKNRAYGYKRNDAGVFVNDMTNLFWVGDGGLHTSVGDMLKWDRNFYEPRVGKNPAALIAIMNRPNSEFTTDTDLYANGQFVREIGGFSAYVHSGGWLGTSTYYARLPALQRSLVMMCNNAGLDIDPLVDQSMEVLISTPVPPPGAHAR